jgi:hypothetical protein
LVHTFRDQLVGHCAELTAGVVTSAAAIGASATATTAATGRPNLLIAGLSQGPIPGPLPASAYAFDNARTRSCFQRSPPMRPSRPNVGFRPTCAAHMASLAISAGANLRQPLCRDRCPASAFAGRKGLLIFGYDYDQCPMNPVIEAFEAFASGLVSLKWAKPAPVLDLIHPHHKGWARLRLKFRDAHVEYLGRDTPPTVPGPACPASTTDERFERLLQPWRPRR